MNFLDKPITEWISVFFTTAIGAGAVIVPVVLYRSTFIFAKLNERWKLLTTLLVIMLSFISIIVIPIILIVDHTVNAELYRNKKKGIPFQQEDKAEKVEKGLKENEKIEFVYCSECGASYIKGEEPDVCEDCGYVIHEK